MAGFVKKCPCLRPKIQEDVYELDYRHCNLTDVPAQVFNFERTLEELFLDNNQIADLPRELFCCHGIRKLWISNNEITSIPPAVGSLINLEELDISKNGVIDIPENINCCKCLRSVNASVNPLGKLPEGLTQLGNLTQLYLNDTFLDYLPGTFGRLLKLKILEIRENHLKTLPKSFSMLTELERLDIGNNEFTELPDVIGNLTHLLELWCDHNQISTITSTLGNLKHLMFLDASANHLQSLPSEIEGCTSLGDLHLTSNHLQSLPESLGNLESLTTLKVDNNQLTALPSTIGGLQSLSELNVSCNELEDLPASLGLLRNLRTFYADENNLLFIPAEVGSCNGITVLSLRNNHLEYIPDEIGRIPKLRVLNLSDNKLKYLPFTITKLKDLQALWLSENQTCPLIPLQSDHDPDNGRKILTCYLLPQMPEEEAHDLSGQKTGGDNDSFHASMWDEERSRRQTIHFAFTEEEDEEGKLVRCPTPYPKDMREKIKQARNLAMRQKNSGGVIDIRWKNGRENKGYEEETCALVNTNSGDVSRTSRPLSPVHTHRLYQYDKEKFAKDKARMQQRHFSGEQAEGSMTPRSKGSQRSSGEYTSPDKMKELPRKVKDKSKKQSPEDDGGFSEKGHPTSLGSVTDISQSVDQASPSGSVSRRSVPAFTYCSPSELSSKLSQFNNSEQKNTYQPYGYSPSGKHKRDYDSDTGYRSESEFVRAQRQHMYSHNNSSLRGVGYESDIDGFTPRKERQKDVGYSSDIEGYSKRVKNAAYRMGPVPIQHSNSGSLPYNLNNPSNNGQVVPNDQFYEQNKSRGESPRLSDSGYNPPSPGMFHRSKIVDQSTPVTAEAPHGFSFNMRSRSGSYSGSQEERPAVGPDWRKDFHVAMEQKMNQSGLQGSPHSQQMQELPTKDRPPPYKPSPSYNPNSQNPTYTSNSQVHTPTYNTHAHRKLPPTPNRNSPYGVITYDRKSNSSPPVYQRISELTINEHGENTQLPRSESPYQRFPGNRARQSPSQNLYSHCDRIDSENVRRVPNSSGDSSLSGATCNSANLMYQHDHDSSHSSGFSSDNSKSRPSISYQSKLSQFSCERARTPASVNGCEERGDSPRESGYSSREHSSHRNSPCDATMKSFFDSPSGLHADHGDELNPCSSSYEDITSYKNTLRESQSRLGLTGNVNGPHVFVKESPTKYSGFSMVPPHIPPPSRPPPSPHSSQNSSRISGQSRGTTPENVLSSHTQHPHHSSTRVVNPQLSREATPEHVLSSSNQHQMPSSRLVTHQQARGATPERMLSSSHIQHQQSSKMASHTQSRETNPDHTSYHTSNQKILQPEVQNQGSRFNYSPGNQLLGNTLSSGDNGVFMTNGSIGKSTRVIGPSDVIPQVNHQKLNQGSDPPLTQFRRQSPCFLETI